MTRSIPTSPTARDADVPVRHRRISGHPFRRVAPDVQGAAPSGSIASVLQSGQVASRECRVSAPVMELDRQPRKATV
jgi:hypothetical protein